MRQRAVTEEESVSLRPLSDPNAGLWVHVKVSPPPFMQNLGTCGVKRPRRLTEKQLLPTHDIIQLGEPPGRLAKLQMLSETRFPFFH